MNKDIRISKILGFLRLTIFFQKELFIFWTLYPFCLWGNNGDHWHIDLLKKEFYVNIETKSFPGMVIFISELQFSAVTFNDKIR